MTIPDHVGDESIVHVYPVRDLREHDCASRGACWCRPEVQDEDGGYIVVHNAMDWREKFETGERKPS